MKKCSRCKIYKSLEEFNFKFKKLNIRQKACKVCTRLEIRNHYIKNREYYLTKAKNRNHIIRQENRVYVWNYLSFHPCLDCGENDPTVLEFDHIREKEFDIAFLIRNNSVREIEQEIIKCEVRCANCHRRKTAKQFVWYKNKNLVPL